MPLDSAWMLAGVAAVGVGLLLFLVALASGLTAAKPTASAQDRIAAFAGSPHRTGQDAVAPPLDQAKDAAATLLGRHHGLEERIAGRLVAAGSAMRASEWLLAHGAITMVAGLVGALLGAGDLLTIVLFLALGAALPWLWLGRRRKKRLEAFGAALPDTLQLIAGGLSAGMSLAQAIDTVVREGSEPTAGEFRRALIDVRLGVPLEVALEEVAQRTESRDFAWAVMAIRIQRQVGGNLAELLTTVADTMRERAYLRRQVQTLSAEGRLSGWILGLLPVGLGLLLLLFRRDYLEPLYTEPAGVLLLLTGVLLLALGAFTMSRIVKVEV